MYKLDNIRIRTNAYSCVVKKFKFKYNKSQK